MKNIKGKKKVTVGSISRYIPLVLWLLFTIVFFGWALLASFSTTRDIFLNKLLHSGFHFQNYVELFKNYNYSVYFLNSIIYTATACVGAVAVAAPAAYALARIAFRGKSLINAGLLSAMSIPGIMLALPLYGLFTSLKISQSILTLIIVYISANVPLTVFFLSGFLTSIPKELEESAAIDGCGTFRTFVSIILPICQPAIITVTIFNCLGVWNDYFYALMFTPSPNKDPVALALENTVQGLTNVGDYGGIFAACMMVFLPTFILYIFLSNKIVAGISVGAIKG